MYMYQLYKKVHVHLCILSIEKYMYMYYNKTIEKEQQTDKIQEDTEMMHELKISEIKKAESLARKLTGKADCKVGGYFTSGERNGVQTFQCEILSNNYEDREIDIFIEAFIPDRRRSWVHA